MAATGAAVPQQEPGTIRLLTITGAAFTVLTAVAYVWGIAWIPPIPRDPSSLVVGRDFLNFWMYGRAAWTPDPSRYYDPQLYNDTLAALLGPHYPGQNWSYPPSLFLLAAPFGRLSYFAALACWTVLGLAVFTWIAHRYLGDKRLLAPVLCSPAVVFCLISGQSALLTAAMLLTIMSSLDRRPVLAGLLLGLLTLKPQLGLLFPVILAASGRWRVFAVASVTALSIAGVTAAVFGAQVWTDYVIKGLPVQNLVLADPNRIATPFYPTVFMNVRGTGASYATAMAAQLPFSAFAVGAAFFAYRRHRNADPLLLGALFFACAICAVPYMLSYDLVAVTCLVVLLLGSDRLDATGQILAKLMYWLPLIQMGFGQYHIPGPALIPAGFAFYLLMRVKALSAASAAETTAALPAVRIS